jgi:hypothetical protein
MNIIDTLAAGLEPVAPVSPGKGMAFVGLALVIAIIAVGLGFGLRPDIMEGSPHPIVLLRCGTLLLLGTASLLAVIASAQPGVGQTSTGWRWALAAALLFPLTSAILSLSSGEFPKADLQSPLAKYCLGISVASGLLIGAALTLWLKQGAPTALNRTAWLVGLCAGSFGAFAYGLHCPSTSIHYVGLWYSAAVLMCAGLGRLLVPHFIRW